MVVPKTNQILSNPNWQRGATVLLRHEHDRQLWCAIPVTCIDNTPSLAVFRISAGVEWLAPHSPSGNRRAKVWEKEWTLKAIPWTTHDVTYLVPRELHFGLGIFAKPESAEIQFFYVNCQDPIKQSKWGYETMDRELDVVLKNCEGEAILKDPGDFRRAVSRNTISPEMAARILEDTRFSLKMIKRPAWKKLALSYASEAVECIPNFEDVLKTVGLPNDIKLALAQNARELPCN